MSIERINEFREATFKFFAYEKLPIIYGELIYMIIDTIEEFEYQSNSTIKIGTRILKALPIVLSVTGSLVFYLMDESKYKWYARFITSVLIPFVAISIDWYILQVCEEKVLRKRDETSFWHRIGQCIKIAGIWTGVTFMDTVFQHWVSKIPGIGSGVFSVLWILFKYIHDCCTHHVSERDDFDGFIFDIEDEGTGIHYSTNLLQTAVQSNQNLQQPY